MKKTIDSKVSLENVENDLLEKGKFFLERYWNAKEYTDYDSFKEKYLKEDNILFNEEMRARLNFDNLRCEETAFENSPYLGSYVKFYEDLKIVNVTGNTYTLYAKAEKYSKMMDNGEVRDFGSDDRDVYLIFQVEGENAYLINLYDGMSHYFNKSRCIEELNKNREIDKDFIPYNKDLRVEYPEEEYIYISSNCSKEEMLRLQLENIKLSSERLQNRIMIQHKMYLQGDPSDSKEEYNNSFDEFISMRSGSYELDRTKARNYARRWAQTAPYCDDARYEYIPGNDCANFASQVLHEAGVPFSSTNIDLVGVPEEWFALRGGTKMSGAWAYAKQLKEFIINNTKSYGKRGPIYWRSAWFYRGEYEPCIQET